MNEQTIKYRIAGRNLAGEIYDMLESSVNSDFWQSKDYRRSFLDEITKLLGYKEQCEPDEISHVPRTE